MAGTKHSTRTTLLVVGFLAAGALHFLDVGDLSINQTAQAVPQVIEGGEFFTEAFAFFCESGSFCGKRVGSNGGCNSRACCEAGDTFCGNTATPAPDVPKVVVAAKGTCWSTPDADPNNQKPWCFVTSCGDVACGVNCTVDQSTRETIPKRKLVDSGTACPGDTK